MNSYQIAGPMQIGTSLAMRVQRVLMIAAENNIPIESTT